MRPVKARREGLPRLATSPSQDAHSGGGFRAKPAYHPPRVSPRNRTGRPARSIYVVRCLYRTNFARPRREEQGNERGFARRRPFVPRPFWPSFVSTTGLEQNAIRCQVRRVSQRTVLERSLTREDSQAATLIRGVRSTLSFLFVSLTNNYIRPQRGMASSLTEIACMHARGWPGGYYRYQHPWMGVSRKAGVVQTRVELEKYGWVKMWTQSHPTKVSPNAPLYLRNPESIWISPKHIYLTFHQYSPYNIIDSIPHYYYL